MLLILALALGSLFWGRQWANPSRHVPPQPLTIGQLRQLADAIPGPKPVAVEMQLLAEYRRMGNPLAAGSGLAPRRLADARFRLMMPGSDPLAIDSRTTRLLGPARPFLGQTAQAVAPGVVVIPAPAYAPDSRMVYARLADGGEYLFAGDIAPLMTSWRMLRVHARMAGDPEPAREAAMRWLVTIQGWKAQDPGLIVVPGQDLAAMIAATRDAPNVNQAGPRP